MKNFLIFIFLLLSMAGFCQVDTNKSFKIPLPDSAPETTPPAETPRKPFELPPTIKDPDAVSDGSLLVDKDKISMTPRNDFQNPGKVYEDRLNKRGEGNQFKALRKNMFLGDFKTDSPYVIVHYRDHGEVDGDKIQLLNNDRVMLLADVLEGRYKTYRIDLSMGINKIDILALNEGLLFPNTAEYEVYAADGDLISANRWVLSTNFKATLIISRE